MLFLVPLSLSLGPSTRPVERDGEVARAREGTEGDI
jgi:hypothetical protein